MKQLYILLFVLLFRPGYSQNITAYSNYRNYFYVFENGIRKEIDYLPVKTYKVGWDCIAYEDNSGTLKIYYKGEISEMFTSASDYLVTKHLALGKLNNQVKVFDNGNMMTLSKNAGSFTIADSLVAFHDKIEKRFSVYYKGEIFQVEDLLISDEISTCKAAGNILAYIDNQNYFKVFYHGSLTNLFPLNSELKYDVGEDVVAYIDNDDLSFNIYYCGQNYRIEDFSPASFIAGNKFVAYIDNIGKFKVFNRGIIETISQASPDFYKVTDDIIVYSEENYFKAYYKSTAHLLEKYIPGSYKYENGTVAYIDNMGSLILFKDGKKETISYQSVKEFELNGNLLKFTIGNECKVYCSGKIY